MTTWHVLNQYVSIRNLNLIYLPTFLANVNVLRYVCYMLSAVRLSSVCLSVCRLSVVCDVGAPYSGG